MIAAGFFAAVSMVSAGWLSAGETGDPTKAPVLPLPPKENPATPKPSPSAAPAAADTKPLKQGPEKYAELRTKDGEVFTGCEVIDAEVDTLLVRHAGGIARLSFFDLPEKVQKEWGFDPFKAIERYKARTAEDRERRWRLLREREAYEAEQARLADLERLRNRAIREWVPVEARVIRRLKDGGVVASCRRVTFEKTKTKSTLGFVIDGPPKRVLVPFADKPVILRFAIPPDPLPAANGVWKGYLNPVSDGRATYRVKGNAHNAAVHAAMPPKP